MPSMIKPLADEYRAITREIALQITKHLLLKLDLPEETVIQAKGEANQLLTFNSEKRKLKPFHMEDGEQFGLYDRLVVEFKESFQDSAINRLRAGHHEIPPIWKHPNLPVELVVQYITTTMELSYTYYSKNAERTHKFRNRLTELLASRSHSFLSSISYAIIPDKAQLRLLEIIHEKQEKVEGYGVDFETWLNQHSSDNALRTLSNIKREGMRYAFKEQQINLPTLIEIMSIPEKSKRDKGPGHEISFEVKFEYEKPRSILMRYPLVIHNQMLPSMYNKGLYHTSPYLKEGVVYNDTKERLEAMNDLFNYHGSYSYTFKEGVIVPLGDDWHSKGWTEDYRPIFTGLAPVPSVHDKGRYKVGNLLAYKNYIRFSQPFLRYLKDHHDKVSYPKFAVLLVEVWKNDERLAHERVIMDDSFNIYVNCPLSKRDMLHVRLLVPVRFTNFSHEFFQQLALYPDFCEELFVRYCRDYTENKVKLINKIQGKTGVQYSSTSNLLGIQRKNFREALSDARQYIQVGRWVYWTANLLSGFERVDSDIKPMLERFQKDHPDWFNYPVLKRYQHLEYFKYEYGLEYLQDNPHKSWLDWYGTLSTQYIKIRLHDRLLDPISTADKFGMINMRTQMFSYIGAKRHE